MVAQTGDITKKIFGASESLAALQNSAQLFLDETISSPAASALKQIIDSIAQTGREILPFNHDVTTNTGGRRSAERKKREAKGGLRTALLLKDVSDAVSQSQRISRSIERIQSDFNKRATEIAKDNTIKLSAEFEKTIPPAVTQIIERDVKTFKINMENIDSNFKVPEVQPAQIYAPRVPGEPEERLLGAKVTFNKETGEIFHQFEMSATYADGDGNLYKSGQNNDGMLFIKGSDGKYYLTEGEDRSLKIDENGNVTTYEEYYDIKPATLADIATELNLKGSFEKSGGVAGQGPTGEANKAFTGWFQPVEKAPSEEPKELAKLDLGLNTPKNG